MHSVCGYPSPYMCVGVSCWFGYVVVRKCVRVYINWVDPAWQTLLPASARDVYYRDEIGNISTSNLREMDDQMELELRPRFPLFGGWKTHYYIGYNVPSYQYLYNQGQQCAAIKPMVFIIVWKMFFINQILIQYICMSFVVEVIML